MPNHSPPLALPDQAPPLPRARIRFSLSLDSRHSTVVSTVPTTGDCAFALVPDEAPPPSALQAPLSLQQRREFGWARVHIVVIALEPQPAVQRPAHVREQQFPSCRPAPSFTSVASVAAALCFLPGHYRSSGMCLCRSCGINIGPLGQQLKTPSPFGLGVAIRSPFCTIRCPSSITIAGPVICLHLHGI